MATIMLLYRKTKTDRFASVLGFDARRNGSTLTISRLWINETLEPGPQQFTLADGTQRPLQQQEIELDWPALKAAPDGQYEHIDIPILGDVTPMQPAAPRRDHAADSENHSRQPR